MGELVKSARRLMVPTQLREVIDLVEQFPYIEVVGGTWCDGWTTRDMDGTKVRRKCTKKAFWKYKKGTTKKPHAKSGFYCWYHLLNDGIKGTKWDESRARRAELRLRDNAISKRKTETFPMGETPGNSTTLD
jgi:hypothetical protein